MKRFRASMKVGAPMVVVLAAVVNSAVASDQPLAVTALARPDLNWAMQSASGDSVQNTRVYLAAKAAAAIHSLDKISGAQAVLIVSARLAPLAPPAIVIARLGIDHVRSTHQQNAP